MQPNNDILGDDKYIVAFSGGTIYIDLPPEREYTKQEIADYLQDNGLDRPIQFYDGRISRTNPYNPVVFYEPPQITATSSLDEILFFVIPLVQEYNLRHAMQIDGKPPTPASGLKNIDEEGDAFLLRHIMIQTGKIKQ